ncbi:fibronectin type III domain-containing protein 4 isoform X2 [Mus caroli]|uniref:Fibronectin type III domain-containing protein 4 isoform X2 n=1 Tax=Mus caroli TaxID=10089 RepID=A0A6P7R5R3_MUSCR|nr:fibronectin type III domain-containing protein 4 isoform X2 [Mus caroli]
MPLAPPANSVETMASLMPLSPYLSPTVLLLVSCDLGFVRADRPPSPVNVTVTHLRANSATVSWDVPEGNIVIGYSISQQRQNGPGQRVIREVNTTTRACALWGLAEDSDYTVQVRSIGLRGESPPGPRVHFRTLKGSDRLPSNSSSPGDITVEGLDGERPLQTGEVVIIVVVLLMWAAVIGLFCRQYDIIKDNDSNNNPKEKGKGPEQSPQGRPVGTRQVMWDQKSLHQSTPLMFDRMKNQNQKRGCTVRMHCMSKGGGGQGKPKMVTCLRLPQGSMLPESQAATHPLSTVSRARM